MSSDPNGNSTHFYGDGCDPPHKADEMCDGYQPPTIRRRGDTLVCLRCGHDAIDHSARDWR